MQDQALAYLGARDGHADVNLLAALIFSYSLTLGANSGAFLAYQTDYYTRQPITLPLFVDLQAELALGPLFFGGGIRDDLDPVAWNAYNPLQNVYTIRGGLRFNLGQTLQLEIVAAHSCYHPELAYSMIELTAGEQIAIPRYEGSLDVFYIPAERQHSRTLTCSGQKRGGIQVCRTLRTLHLAPPRA